MIRFLELKNIGAKEFLKASAPLAVGFLSEYAEWEVLTIFAAVLGLGPAEAAAWAVLGFVWNVVFESFHLVMLGRFEFEYHIKCSWV
jgi:hypothetical protein